MRLAARGFIFATLSVLVVLPMSALAQPPAETFAEVPRVLETGRNVVITEVDGRRTKGRIVEIGPTSVTLIARDEWGTEQRHVFADTSISTIKKPDSVWNGLLIGLGAGIVASELFVRQNCGPRGYDDECAAIATGVGLVTFVPGGAVIGALVDKFKGDRVLYRAEPRATMSIGPIVRPATGGVAVSLRFD